MVIYNLIDRPWISIISTRGPEQVGLREAMERAHECQLALVDPLQLAALLRQVVLPVVVDACGLPRDYAEWADRFELGRLDSAATSAYLDEHHDRFDLFHPEHPFGQVAGLEALNHETRPVSLLIPAIASGNNVPLFSARTEADNLGLSAGEAALAMLATQCWDTSGIKTGAVGDPLSAHGKTMGNPVGCAGRLGLLIPWADTLFATLMLNLPVRAGLLARDDSPVWRRPEHVGPGWETRPARGLLDLWTWQSRRIRLVQPDDAEGEITRVVLTAGDRLSLWPSDVEPHCMRRVDVDASDGQVKRRPQRHRSDRALWQGLPGLLALDAAGRMPGPGETVTSSLILQLADLVAEGRLPEGLPIQVLAIGVEYGNQQAVIENVIVDSVPLPMAALTPDPALRDAIVKVARMSDGLRMAIGQLAADLRRASGASQPEFGSAESLLGRLDPAVREFLARLQASPLSYMEALDQWMATAESIAFEVAEPMLAAVSPSAFRGRRDERAKPDAAKGNAEWWHRAATAEMQYRRKVHQTLGHREKAQLAAGGAK